EPTSDDTVDLGAAARVLHRCHLQISEDQRKSLRLANRNGLLDSDPILRGFEQLEVHSLGYVLDPGLVTEDPIRTKPRALAPLHAAQHPHQPWIQILDERTLLILVVRRARGAKAEQKNRQDELRHLNLSKCGTCTCDGSKGLRQYHPVSKPLASA